MKDILGRHVEEGALVVAKATGRRSSRLRIGVFTGKSVRFKNSNGTYDELFLIKNPTEDELKIKNEIIDIINKEKEHKELAEKERRTKKAILYKDLVIGNEYVDDRNSKMLFLGYGKVTEYSRRNNYGNWTLEEEKEGYIYINEGYGSSDYELNYSTMNRFHVFKSKRRLVEKTDKKININNEVLSFEHKEQRIWDSDSYYKIEFNLKEFKGDE